MKKNIAKEKSPKSIGDNKMKYKLQLVKDNNKVIWEHQIPKIEVKGIDKPSIKVKFLPSLTLIKDAIRKDIIGR